MNLINEIVYSHANSYLIFFVVSLGILLLSYLKIINMPDELKKKMLLIAFLSYLLFLLVHFRFITPYGE